MGTCLNTKFNAHINKGLLPKVDSFFVKTSQETDGAMGIRYKSGYSGGATGVAKDENGNVLQTINASDRYLTILFNSLPAATVYVEIDKKFEIEAISGTAGTGASEFIIESKDLRYSDLLTSIDTKWIKMFESSSNISDLPRSLASLYIAGSNISGNVSEFASFPNLTTVNIAYSNVTGTIESLGEQIFRNAVGRTISISSATNCTFNSTAVNSVEVKLENSTVTVKINNVEKGTYNGSTWTYA